jgi:hypothetical protein
MPARNDRPLGALLFQVSLHGLKALDDPRNAARLARLDPKTRAEVDAQIVELVNERVRRTEKQEQAPRRTKARGR